MLPRSIYRSKIDPWALPLLAVLPLIPAIAALLTHAPVAYLSFSVVFLLYFLLVFPVTYRLEADALEIRSGVIHWRVPYAQMRSVRRTRSAMAAPALSFDRLEICYGSTRQALISPGDANAFLADLHARAPHLQLPDLPTSGT